MALQLDQELHAFAKLLDVMRQLRDPQNGCPWDLKQTHQSIRSNLLEETHEALEALDANDEAQMIEEFGDVLFQIVFHAQIANEEGAFSVTDILKSIVEKLINRHPHVFGDPKETTAEEVLGQWEQIKAAERAVKGRNRQSVLDGIPSSMPALASAQSMTARADRTKLSYEYKNTSVEEITSLIEIANDSTNTDIREKAIGDALFLLTGKAEMLNVDAESALREANQRFREQIRQKETLIDQ